MLGASVCLPPLLVPHLDALFDVRWVSVYWSLCRKLPFTPTRHTKPQTGPGVVWTAAYQGQLMPRLHYGTVPRCFVHALPLALALQLWVSCQEFPREQCSWSLLSSSFLLTVFSSSDAFFCRNVTLNWFGLILPLFCTVLVVYIYYHGVVSTAHPFFSFFKVYLYYVKVWECSVHLRGSLMQHDS